MAQEQVAVPNIGDASDVDVVEVLVAPGARVEREQTLIVLESEKASMDVPSPSAGVVKEVKIKVGDKASEGTLILVLDTEGGGDASQPSAADEKKPAKKEPAQAKKAKDEPAPKQKKPEPKKEEPEAEEEEASEEPEAEEDDAEEPEAEQDDDEAPVDEAEAPKPAAKKAEAPKESKPQDSAIGRRTAPPAPPVQREVASEQNGRSQLPYASPAIRRFGRELGVDLARVSGTARGGRITKEDVQNYVKQAMRGAAGGGVLALSEAPEIDFSQFGPTTKQALTKIQRLTGKNLHRSWVTIPHVTQFDEADITELEAFRKQLRAENPELKLTLVAFFMKALVYALKRMPRFNSSLDKSGEQLILKQYFHIGVAVDTPNGLVVPVIRDVDRKSLSDLAKELETVSERARAKRLQPNDMQGASITISSLGGIGGTAFTPIINPPEVAVLGVSRARFAPVYKDGAFVPRLVCPLSLSYDHRVIDGADGARFTSLLRTVLSDIRQLLL